MKKIQALQKMNPLLFLIILSTVIFGACSKKSSTPEESPPPQNGTRALASGQITLTPKLQDQADPLSVLFLIARNPAGQIIAVKKLLPPFQYPVTFTLTEADRMISDQLLPKELSLKARLDKDGNANPDQTEDIVGFSQPATFSLGEEKITIELNQQITNPL